MSEYKGYDPIDIGKKTSDAEYYESLEKRKKLFIREHGESKLSDLLFWREIIKEYEQIENTPWERIKNAIDGNSCAYSSLVLELKSKKRNKKEEEIWQSLDHHDIESVLKEISVELGRDFDSHGFQCGQPFERLISILDKGISNQSILNTIQLRTPEGGGMYFGTGFDGPPTGSEFFIISDYKKTLNYSGVGFVVLSDMYKDSISLFKRRFPNVEFVLLENLKSVLEGKVEKASEEK